MLASTSHPAAAVARLAELSLPGRVHLGLTATEPVPRLSSGIARVDALLGGGVPRGRISELLGALTSGKTSLLLLLLAAATRRGEVVACVDLADALYPASVAAAGADLQRVLWVRPPSITDGLRCTELLLQAGGFAVVAFDIGVSPPRRFRSRVWPRLLYAAEQSHTALVVVAPRRVAGSSAVLSLGLRVRAPLWLPGAWPLFDGFETTLQVERNKLGAPGQSMLVKCGSPAAGFFPSPRWDFRFSPRQPPSTGLRTGFETPPKEGGSSAQPMAATK